MQNATTENTEIARKHLGTPPGGEKVDGAPHGEKGEGRKWRGEVNAMPELRRAETEQRGGEQSPARHGSARIETGNLTFDSATERNCARSLAESRPFSVVQFQPCIFLRKSADDPSDGKAE